MNVQELKELSGGQKNNMKEEVKGIMGDIYYIYKKKKMPMQSAIIIVMGITSIVIHFTIKHDFILTE
jgi:hypothetical protein